jgi:hypothetical protein
MDELLAKDVAKGKIQNAEAKDARERIIVIDPDRDGINGFRDVDMVVEVRVSSSLLHPGSKVLSRLFLSHCL